MYLGPDHAGLTIHEGTPLMDYWPLADAVNAECITALCARCSTFKEISQESTPAPGNSREPLSAEALDDAIRAARFIQNSCLRYWMDNQGVSRNDLYKYCKVLADTLDFPWAKKLNSQARQAAAERTWSAIARFYDNCKKQIPGKIS